MKNKKLIIGVIIVAAILILGIAYAAISNITLNINGTAGATPSDANFRVEFTGTPKVGDAKTTTATISSTDKKAATMTVNGLTAKGDKATATYNIKDLSPDLSAELSATTTNSNTNNFKVSYTFGKTLIKTQEETTITVTVELLKTPVTANETATIGVTLTAKPVQPTT